MQKNNDDTLNTINKLLYTDIEMDAFTSAAKKKIRDLLERDSLKEITLITKNILYLRFDDSACKVSANGDIYWFKKSKLIF